MRSFPNLIKLTAGLAIISLPGVAISAPPGNMFRPDVPFGLEELPPRTDPIKNRVSASARPRARRDVAE